MRRFVPILLLALLPAAASAEQSSLGLSYVRTNDLRLIYFDWLGYLAPHVVSTFTNSLEWQRKMFGWTPSEATTILLKDLSDYGNASTWAAPWNTMFVDVAPLSHAFETYPASERMYTLMNHELVHVAQADLANDEDRRWRKLFLGKIYPQSQNPETLLYSWLTIPRFNAPRWYNEGGAVFLETWMGGGLGRAQGGYDEMVFRAMVRDGAHFYGPLGLASRGTKVDFQVGANAYLYGTRFFTWLGYAYSPEQVIAWIRRDEASAGNYAEQFRLVFGLTLDDAWARWIAFEHDFQRKNLAAIREHPVTKHRALAATSIGSISRMFYDERSATIYAAFRYPGVVEHVGALDTRSGSVRPLADLKEAMLYRVASVAFDAQSGTIFYTDGNRTLRDLMAVDVKSGEERRLIRNARVGDLVFNPVDRSLLGIQHVNGLAALVRIPYPYTESTQHVVFPYESVPYDLDISADGKLLSASMSEVTSDQFVRVWELDRILAGDTKPLSEFKFGQSIPESFVFTKDGRYLYGSSYYTGVSNIFRYEVATGDVVAVSNAETGYFRPVPLADGRLVVLTYTGEGFVPATFEPHPLEDVSAITFLGAEVAAKHPVVTTWQVPPPSAVDEQKLIVERGPYEPLGNVRLANAFPVLQGYKERAGIGYHFNFQDPLGFAKAGLTAAYTPSSSLPANQRGHIDAWGSYLGWRAALSWNRSDFYDLFGPTQRSRKGYAAKLGYDWILIYDEPRKLDVVFDVAYYDQIDTLPTAQNVETPFTRLTTAEVALRYTDVRRSLGAVEDEKGLAWQIHYVGNYVSGEVTPQLYGTLGYGFALPIPHSALWSHTAAGIADVKNSETVANFYFGGFGNNYVDDKEIKRYREYYSLPGFGLNQVSGLDFVKELVEWDLPPYVFENAGTPGFYLTWLRPSVFAAGLATNLRKGEARRDFASVGAQADLRFTILHWYDMTLSFGFATGFESGRRAGTEWMVSLKIM
jgi:hypothetical protein